MTPLFPARNMAYFILTSLYFTQSSELDPKTGAIQFPPTTLFFSPAVEANLTSSNSRQGLPTAHHATQSTAKILCFHDLEPVIVAVSNGDDRIKEFGLDLNTGTLTDRGADLISPLGSGALESTVSVFDFVEKKLLSTYKNIPADFTGVNTAAEIVVHPHGRFFVAVYTIDPTSFLLTQTAIVPSGGAFPRYITLLSLDSKKNNRYVLLLANHNTPNIVAFSVKSDTALTQIYSDITPLPAFGMAVSRIYKSWKCSSKD
ncbi:hypothetical protein BJ742DRAFT_886212 [Cladochytrium replicatum]|nr:hypothetical protein BJ742DRAFT_886212 [Cladochytrium replicatum]